MTIHVILKSGFYTFFPATGMDDALNCVALFSARYGVACWVEHS